MEDSRIIELFFSRDESALDAFCEKYKNYIMRILSNILCDTQDSEECMQDTMVALWDTIPPERPRSLGAYAARIARNKAIIKYRYNHSQKRDENISDIISELDECLPSRDTTEDEVENKRLGEAINAFVAGLALRERVIFTRRYWYSEPIENIARGLGIRQNTVRVILHRIRSRMKKHLEKEGFSQ